MISRAHRFHGYNSLRYVYTKGQTVRGPLFAVKSAINPKRKNYRVAVVVSKKVSKSAVRRNRIRRRLYEIIRAFDGNITQPYDIVITVFHDTVAEEPYESLASHMKKQLAAAGITE